MSNELTIIPMSDIEKMGKAIAASGLFGFKKPEEAIALMLIAQAEGLHPAIAAIEYNIILGKPALKADAMLARFQKAGGKVEWIDYSDDKVTGIFSHPSGGGVKIEWTMKRAIDAGLGLKDNWKKWPRQMLRSRVISEGVRTVYPGISVGIYTPEEVIDFDDRPTPIVHPTPAEDDGNPPYPEAAIIPEAQGTKLFTAPPLPNNKAENEPIISEAQGKRFYAIGKGAGKSDDQLHDILAQYGIKSSKGIPNSKYEEICAKAGLKTERKPGEE